MMTPPTTCPTGITAKLPSWSSPKYLPCISVGTISCTAVSQVVLVSPSSTPATKENSSAGARYGRITIASMLSPTRTPATIQSRPAYLTALYLADR
ncbi:MAG TPA: hypothetical protein VJR06_05610 [Nitrososphaerales archaeon]|nr:hypothetical protein [Nitrososphaerales archaeon]